MRKFSYHITTLGCPKNQADSRAMEKSLLQGGFSSAENAEVAEFHIINSCAFIESAREETIQTVLDASDIKRSSPEQKIILVGCFSERYSSTIIRELPEVDLCFGTNRYDKTASILTEHFHLDMSEKEALADQNSLYGASDRLLYRTNSVYAPVKISDGCSRSCTFCAIPSFRGRFHEREEQEILSECRELVKAGVKELCLVSQDTNAYGADSNRFVELIEKIAEIDDLKWLRLLYLYPDKKTLKILEKLGSLNLPALVPYLESPVQHVSPAILKAMGRSGSYELYRDIFSFAREMKKDTEIRTAFLVGFPGEKTEDVDLLLRFIEEVRPEKLALFAFSPEEGTPAHAMGKKVSKKETVERINLLRETHLNVLRGIQATRVGKIYSCIIEDFRDGKLIGRRPQDAPEVDEIVFIDGTRRASTGDIIPVEIDGFFEYDMTGIPVTVGAKE